jgi:thiol-disulfide isomerase/thioredoxin
MSFSKKFFIHACACVFCTVGFLNPSWAETGSEKHPYLDVYSKDGCVACDEFKDVLKQLAEQYAGRINFFVFNTRDIANRERVLKYKIKGTPSIVFFGDKDNFLELHKGKMTLDEILAIFAKHGFQFLGK